MNRFTVILVLASSLVLFSGSLNAQVPLVYYDSVEVTRDGLSLDNPWAGGLNCPQFSETDLDGDGVSDLVVFERNFYGAVKTFVHTGNPGISGYRYAPQYQIRFPWNAVFESKR